MKLFLSYRRDDSTHLADRIYARLIAHFGADAVFKDVDSVPVGSDFRRVIEEAVGSCDVLLAIIGSRWCTGAENSRPRIDNPEDFVRLEIETALARDIRVIPVVEDLGHLPNAKGLPSSLGALASRQSALVRRDPDFARDMDRLIGQLDDFGGDASERPNGHAGGQKLKYFAYVSRSKVAQLYDQLATHTESPLPVRTKKGRHSPASGPEMVFSNPPSVIRCLNAVVDQIRAREKVGDLEALCRGRGDVPLTAFCYSYQGPFFTLGSITRNPDGGVTINGPALRRSSDTILLSKSLLIEPARAENSIREAGPNKSGVVSDICIICSEIADYTLRLACSYKFFSDMGGAWDKQRGEWRIHPHSGNYHFFSGETDVWYEALLFVNGIRGKTILGTPLYLALANDPSLRL